jgi:anhydro-N-acetylmuramic acid kinase
MSGTSLDGVDAALVDLGAPLQLVGTAYAGFPADLRDELLDLHADGPSELHRAALASNRLAECYANAVNDVLKATGTAAHRVVAIGCHGQTVRHRPDAHYTLQLNNAALLAELSGITVVSDFRSRDIAAGGHGAPLVPAFHAANFHDASRNRVIVNIGGIANITALPAADTEGIIGFDTGPGNLLLDTWARRHLQADHDAGGRFAATGRVHERLLTGLLADPYFAAAPPKSTGRDHFNTTWMDGHLEQITRSGGRGPSNEDVQATLAELTARSIANAIRRWCPGTQEAYVCGGGAHNADLMLRLDAALSATDKPISLASTEILGMHPDWVEAMAFAWLAQQALLRRPANLPAVTGARGPRVLGTIHYA